VNAPCRGGWNDFACDVYHCEEPVYNVCVNVRFQIDDGALQSAATLCEQAYFHRGAAPESMANIGMDNRWLGCAEIGIGYIPRTIALENNVESMPAHDQLGSDPGMYCDKVGDGPDSLLYMEYCWFGELFQDGLGSLAK
jgi:hypothetical protein